MTLPADFYTFKDLDTRYGRPKGSAFRAFKGQLRILCEGQDFIQLQATEHPEEIAELRAAGRLYQGTLNPVLLLPSGYQQLLPWLNPPAP